MCPPPCGRFLQQLLTSIRCMLHSISRIHTVAVKIVLSRSTHHGKTQLYALSIAHRCPTPERRGPAVRPAAVRLHVLQILCGPHAMRTRPAATRATRRGPSCACAELPLPRARGRPSVSRRARRPARLEQLRHAVHLAIVPAAPRSHRISSQHGSARAARACRQR